MTLQERRAEDPHPYPVTLQKDRAGVPSLPALTLGTYGCCGCCVGAGESVCVGKTGFGTENMNAALKLMGDQEGLVPFRSVASEQFPFSVGTTSPSAFPVNTFATLTLRSWGFAWFIKQNDLL